MNFSPQDRKAILERAAEIIAETLLSSMDTPEELVVLPVQTVASLTGMHRNTVKRRMEIIAHGSQSTGVRLSELRRYLDGRAKPPTDLSPTADDGEQVPPLAIVSNH